MKVVAKAALSKFLIFMKQRQIQHIPHLELFKTLLQVVYCYDLMKQLKFTCSFPLIRIEQIFNAILSNDFENYMIAKGQCISRCQNANVLTF